MNLIRVAILIGQLGRIWTVSSRSRNLFQTISVLGYFQLMETTYGNEQIFTINGMSNEDKSLNAEVIYKPIKFDKRPW